MTGIRHEPEVAYVEDLLAHLEADHRCGAAQATMQRVVQEAAIDAQRNALAVVDSLNGQPAPITIDAVDLMLTHRTTLEGFHEAHHPEAGSDGAAMLDPAHASAHSRLWAIAKAAGHAV